MRNHWRCFYANICLPFVKKYGTLCHMGKKGKHMINVQIQIRKMDDMIISKVFGFSDNKNTYNVSKEFANRGKAKEYLQSLIDNGIVSQDLFDTFRGIKSMFEDAIVFVENGEEDYTTAVDKETWIKIWIE